MYWVDRLALALTLNSPHAHTRAHRAARIHDLYKCLVCVYFPLVMYSRWAVGVSTGVVAVDSTRLQRRHSIHSILWVPLNQWKRAYCMRSSFFSLFWCSADWLLASLSFRSLCPYAYSIRVVCMFIGSTRVVSFFPSIVVVVVFYIFLVLFYTGQCVLCLPGRVRLPSFGFHFHLATVRESTAREVVAFSS